MLCIQYCSKVFKLKPAEDATFELTFEKFNALFSAFI
jgi:hypothetical protein